MLTVGLGGVSRNGCVAICDQATVVGVCEQERVTRVRGAGFNPSGLPDEALDTLLERAGHRRSDIGRYIAAEAGVQLGNHRLDHLDHHLAHAATAYLTSPFSSAVIVVCDLPLDEQLGEFAALRLTLERHNSLCRRTSRRNYRSAAAAVAGITSRSIRGSMEADEQGRPSGRRYRSSDPRGGSARRIIGRQKCARGGQGPEVLGRGDDVLRAVAIGIAGDPEPMMTAHKVMVQIGIRDSAVMVSTNVTAPAIPNPPEQER